MENGGSVQVCRQTIARIFNVCVNFIGTCLPNFITKQIIPLKILVFAEWNINETTNA